jgi:hypothetical protein
MESFVGCGRPSGHCDCYCDSSFKLHDQLWRNDNKRSPFTQPRHGAGSLPITFGARFKFVWSSYAHLSTDMFHSLFPKRRGRVYYKHQSTTPRARSELLFAKLLLRCRSPPRQAPTTLASHVSSPCPYYASDGRFHRCCATKHC